LYNIKQKQFISEEYQIYLTQHGMPEIIENFGKMKTIFKVFIADIK